MDTQKTKSFLKKAWKITSYSTGYALGGGVTQVFTLYYMGFLMFAMGLPPLLAGAVIAIGKIWDGFIDPIMGILVDRTKTRFGSCRPWFLASAIPVFLSYFMLWYCFGIEGNLGRFFYFLFAQFCFSTAYSMGTVPYEAILPKIVDSYNERTNYSSLRFVFSGIASVGGSFIYSAMIPAETVEEYVGMDMNFMKMGLVLGAIFAIPLLITFIGTKEKPRIDTISRQKDSLKSTFKSYGELLKSKLYVKCYILTMLGAFLYYAIAVTLVIYVLLIYGNRHYDNFPIFGTITLALLVVNIRDLFESALFVPNFFIMKKFGKHRPF
ncbi:MAG: MFS transporter, partial [Clostridiales bacterium]|nr:MFS transporter [Clostridiales bacterium]